MKKTLACVGVLLLAAAIGVGAVGYARREQPLENVFPARAVELANVRWNQDPSRESVSLSPEQMASLWDAMDRVTYKRLGKKMALEDKTASVVCAIGDDLYEIVFSNFRGGRVMFRKISDSPNGFTAFYGMYPSGQAVLELLDQFARERSECF